MNTISEITTKNEWDKFLSEIKSFDFYHTYDYHQLSKSEGEKVVLLTYVQGDIHIGFPVVIRPIPNTMYFDATSVYGYSGPLGKNIPSDFNNRLFIDQLNKYFNSKNIISVFSRLNPFIDNQNSVLKGYGEIENHGKLVNIDLSEDVIIQRQKYQSRLKTHINKSRRSCFVRKATSDADILEFIAVYHENMDRVNAKSSYYFDNDYFFDFLKSKNFSTEVLLALDNETNTIIAGSMFVKTNNIIQYHLSGTKNDYLHLMPNKLLIDEMRIKGTEEGYAVLNLGGGLGGNENDSLFKFKSSFSKSFKDFELWKLIVDQKKYNQLVNDLELENSDGISFFPLYRYS